MKATLRGTEIYYDIAGMQLIPTKKGLIERPVIFMLHGGPGGDHLRYKQHSLELQSVAQLVFIDHRGCGRSKRTKTSDYTLENNIEDIEALRKLLGLEKIIILGTSYGGMVAQGYAIRYPQHVAKLILVVTSPSYRFLAEAKAFVAMHGSSQQIAICEDLWEGRFRSRQHLAKYFKLLDPLYSASVKKNQRHGFSKSATIWNYEALNIAFSGFLRKFDFTKQLKKIKCPTLVIAGEKDWICSPNQAKIIASSIPKATLKIFRNASHAVAIDAHAAYIKLIKQFIQKK